MAWIKRNLYFVITVVVALGATGYCGYLLYSVMGQNADAAAKYESAKSTLEELEKSSPFPSEGNIKVAEADAGKVRTFLYEFKKPFAPFPTPPKVDVQGFNTYLIKSIAEFRAAATNAGVGLDASYDFSFGAQLKSLNHPIEAIAPWMQQVEEIRALLHILYSAKINYLERVKRIAVSVDDGGNGDDYILFTNTTTSFGTVTPYSVNFRAFSAEIANVLSGIASSSNCFIIKAIYVQPSGVALPDPQTQPQATPAAPAPQFFRQQSPNDFSPNPIRRRGEGARGERGAFGPRPFIPAQPPPEAGPAVPAGPEIIEFERPLFVTLYIDVVKLKPEEKPVAPTPGAAAEGAPRSRRGAR